MENVILKILNDQRIKMGGRQDPIVTGRLAEAKRITALLHKKEAFSLVRLGDFDVAFLLATENGFRGNLFPDDLVISGTEGLGSPGLDSSQAVRLRAALESADYADFWDLQWKDGTMLDRLALNRNPGTTRNPTRETSFILPTWMEYEFKEYCQNRKILFCGAEAPLLEELLRNPEYRAIARDYWPDQCEASFLRPRENGRKLSKNLDGIKKDIAETIDKYGIDTLLLSLGGGAKILCCELAQEVGIRAIDFGAFMRSLTYSGSDGNRASRSTHAAYLFRVPFAIYMDALEKTYPNLTSEELLAKAHAQLILEMQKKEVGWSHSAWEYDFSSENLRHFKEGNREYRRRYNNLFKKSDITQKERADFLHFCGTHKLTWEGIFFFYCFKIKGWFKQLLK